MFYINSKRLKTVKT